MNVSLPQALVDFVEGEVASGGYGSASELVRDALRLLRREKAAEEERLAILHREVGVGLREAQEGRFSDRTIEEIAAAIAEEDR